MSIGLEKQAYDTKVLDPENHGRLVKEIESVARRANIPVQMVWTSMTGPCTKEEISYVRELRQKSGKNIHGLAYIGTVKEGASILERMSLAAAACVRNYINAQVMTAGDVIQGTQAGTMPNPTVLMVPNFYIGHQKDVPAWRSSALLDMLYSRQQESLQTFVYVSDMTKLGIDYGEAFVEHLKRFRHVYF